jgi:alpha-L-rhamnosidase
MDEFGIHAASDAINSGMLNGEEESKMYENAFTDRQNRLSYSPFNQYFIIRALSRMDKYDDALETIRDQWGGQIKYGATTFFENFRPSWNEDLNLNDAPPNGQCGYTSIAHPWGGGVVKWISEEILGVKPLTPGFLSVEIMPHLGRTLTMVEGKVPSPQGAIQVVFDVSEGSAHVIVPPGITATVGIPKAEKEIISIQLNGKPVWQDQTAVQAQNKIKETKEFIVFSDLEGGTYDFAVEYSGETPEYVESEWVFPATFTGQDSLTRGEWKGRYGKEGYVLFNYLEKDGKPKHLQSLKGGIVDVTLNLNADSIWGIDLDDKRVLKPDNQQVFTQNAGAIFTQDPRACWQTMTIDVKLARQDEYEFSLYFLDWDKQSRRTAIEVIDLNTKNIIAPVRIVENYAGGRYMTFRYNNSVRFRINHVRGPNAVVSGIFFDKAKSDKN